MLWPWPQWPTGHTRGTAPGSVDAMLSPIHTADADATQLSSWVASAVWTHPSAVVIDPVYIISCAAELLRLVTSDDIVTSLLKSYQYRSKFTSSNPSSLFVVSFQIVDRIRRHSSWASCEFCTHRRRRRDKTVSSRRRRRCVLGITLLLPFCILLAVYWTLPHYSNPNQISDIR